MGAYAEAKPGATASATAVLTSRRVLLEREREREELVRLVDEARSGEGRVLMVQGAAGAGKTRLLEEARVLADANGVDVLSARGGELERDFSFGIVRSLLEPALARASPREREELMSGAARLAEPVFAVAPERQPASLDAAHATLHGLYWLVANLSQRAPLLLTVDDLHWADEPSVRFLLHLARRLDGLSVAVLLAIRTSEAGTDPELARQLALEARRPALHPRPLSSTAVQRLIRTELGDDAGPELCAACYTATAGNPFFLWELVAELRSEGKPVRTISAPAVGELGPERIAASLLMRVGRLGGAAPAFARAVAILGTEASVADAAALADLEAAEARSLAAAFADAAAFERGEPLRFVHPIARTAIAEEMPQSVRVELHRRAGRILAARGAPPASVAMHLLATGPTGDQTAVTTLLAAGRAALTSGAPAIAASYLRRALAEPPREKDRFEVLHLLGLAEVGGGDPVGVEHLRQAAAAAPAGRTRSEVTRSLVQILIPQGRFPEAFERLEAAAAELDDSERALRLRMEVEAASAARHSPTTYEWGAGRLRSLAEADTEDTPAGRMLLAALSYQRGFDGGSAREVADLARRALHGGLLTEAGMSPVLWDALFALIMTHDVDLAEHHCQAALAAARANASLVGVVVASSFTALLAYRRGQLARAESEARGALEAATIPGYETGMQGFAAGWLIEILIERGQLADAEAVLAAAWAGEEIPDSTFLNYLLRARGLLRLALGQTDRGIADLELFEARVDQYPGRKIPWRTRIDLAPALARRGNLEQARRLADGDMELARIWGTRLAIGMALRAQALVEGSHQGIDLLHQAVATLEGAEAQLEYAKALVDLGAALRRAGRTRDARDRLAAGMHHAHTCGAMALLERARDELVIAGARPRRPALSGVDSLTPSERRVAEMAGQGMTNKDIAEALFVTLRTVEMHLSNAYGKLEIRSRRQLPKALATR
jgi:DNA-binding CsgD family transcriptional regulator/tetratricopeptide (TPR) repeat protein